MYNYQIIKLALIQSFTCEAERGPWAKTICLCFAPVSATECVHGSEEFNFVEEDSSSINHSEGGTRGCVRAGADPISPGLPGVTPMATLSKTV